MLIISSSCIQHYLWLLGGLPRKLQTEHIAAIETAVLKILSHLKISLYHRSLTGDTHTHTQTVRDFQMFLHPAHLLSSTLGLLRIINCYFQQPQAPASYYAFRVCFLHFILSCDVSSSPWNELEQIM